MGIRRLILCLLIVILLVLSAGSSFAAIGLGGVKKDKMMLLAVAETQSGEFKGQIAELELEMRPGTGDVFINTFPSTKLDTQISTRFAMEIACKYTKAECSNYDFLYTITSSSTLVGGPSASAATTILTIAMLEGISLDKTAAMTGTINSGYLIGAVSGIKEKIEVAQEKGLKKVLIPEGTLVYKDRDNQTIDLGEFGESIGVEVVEVGDVDESLFQFTGVMPESAGDVLEVNPGYESIMKGLSEDLCQRSDAFFDTIAKAKLDSSLSELKQFAVNSTSESDEEYAKGNYYSAASLCFGANVNLNEIYLFLTSPSLSEINKKAGKIREDQRELYNYLQENSIETISDLQAYNIVMDRLYEVDEGMENLRQAIENNQTNRTYHYLAFSTERLYSAYAWAEFYNHNGQRFDFNKDNLKESCLNKIYEAEERFNYVNMLIPGVLKNVREEIDDIYTDYNNGNNARCLYRASLAKSRCNLVLSSMNLPMEKVDDAVARKISAAKRSLIDETEQGIFPIMAYSYYEYAQTLQERGDHFSALLYLEFALELSNLDIYFTKEKISVGGAVLADEIDNGPFDFQINWNTALKIFYGVFAVACLVLIVLILIKLVKRLKVYKSRFKRTKLKLRED